MRLSATDLEILRLVEAHRQPQAEVAASLGVSLAKIGNVLHKARRAGLVQGLREGLKIDWARLEKLRDPVSGAVAEKTDPVLEKSAAGCITPVIRCNTAGSEVFTPAEAAALKKLAGRELARIPAERSGETQMVSGRLDSGLVAMLKEYAEGRGLSLTQALDQAVEALLHGR